MVRLGPRPPPSQQLRSKTLRERRRLAKQLVGVRGNRTVTKASMVHNATMPVMEIDPQTYEVRADGVLLTCEPATVLPMAQKYFLF